MSHGNQRPEIELVRAFMPVLVTSNFDDFFFNLNNGNHFLNKNSEFMSYKMINFLFLHTMGRIKENFRMDSVCICCIERPVTLSLG